MCKQCLITANHDVCVLNYVNDMNSRSKKQKANVSYTRNQRNKSQRASKGQSNGDNACTSNPQEPSSKRFPNPTFFLGRLSKFVYGALTRVVPSMFLGTVRFGNDRVAAILGYDLEVAFKRNTCFIRNLKGVDLLKGNRTTNLYTINLHDMAYASPICLMARATSTKSWALYYPKNDREYIGKLGTKCDIGFFIGYSANSCAYRFESIMMKKFRGQPSAALRTVPAAQAPQVLQTPTTSTTIADNPQPPHRHQQTHPIKLQIF
ncbi:hypothetical protein Tco_0349608 [Tanacetum coccineum]